MPISTSSSISTLPAGDDSDYQLDRHALDFERASAAGAAPSGRVKIPNIGELESQEAAQKTREWSSLFSPLALTGMNTF
jgi:hypothetical protein